MTSVKQHIILYVLSVFNYFEQQFFEKYLSIVTYLKILIVLILIKNYKLNFLLNYII